ncbi:MAG TPA: His/Gly/Thr/Pro-type tRNA ligase C-terminal domain-containing protein, partial [Candidatus Paceibacterota bacterium]
YDDRVEKTAGERFADADLIGIPYRVVISASTLAQKGVEVKERAKPQTRLMTPAACIKMLTK